MSEAGPEKSAPGKRSLSARIGRITLLGVGPLVLAVAGGAYVVATAPYVTTENAYIKAEKIAVSTDVTGHVAEVLVRENDLVNPGQLLFRLDESRFRILLDQKQAALEQARQQVEALRALYRQKSAELESRQEEISFFNSEYTRAKKLKKQGHLSRSNYDKVRRDHMVAQHRIEAMRQDLLGVLANLGGDPSVPVDQHPRVLAALTDLQHTALDLERTEVLAPAKAIVSNIELQPGEYVEEGEPVFSLVHADHFWIEANLKETDLTHVREGQSASVVVDAYPGRTWPAKVVGIAPATGAEFALLPPQNASGNWVKVVQRIPVRLTIEPKPTDPPLRAGMSVQVEIDTGVELDLPSPIRAGLAWVTGEEAPVQTTGDTQTAADNPPE